MLHCCRYYPPAPAPSCPMVQPVSLSQTGYPILSTRYHCHSVPGAVRVSSESGNSALAPRGQSSPLRPPITPPLLKGPSCRFTVGVACFPRDDEWHSYWCLVAGRVNWGNFRFFSGNSNKSQPGTKSSDLSPPPRALCWLAGLAFITCLTPPQSHSCRA